LFLLAHIEYYGRTVAPTSRIAHLLAIGLKLNESFSMRLV